MRSDEPQRPMAAALTEHGAAPGDTTDTRKPGRARRYEHGTRAAFMAAHAARCAESEFRAHRPIDKYELFDALTYWPNVRTDAVPNLTGAEARMLAVYFSVIPPDDILSGTPIGSMSIAMLSARLGVDESRVRLLRRSIEAKGLAWRSYNGGNHQASREGFDLIPLLDMARAVHAELRDRMQMVYDRREALRENIDTGGLNYPGRRVEPSRHIQTPPTPPIGAEEEVQHTASVLTSDESRDRKPYGTPINTSSGGTAESCSATRASGGLGGQNSTRVEAEIARAALRDARQFSKSIRAATSPGDVDRLNLAQLYTAIVRALPTLDPRFPVKTFEWAVRECGWRAIPALAVALDDPTVGARVSWFAALTRGRFKIRDDYASNYKRMARAEQESALETASATPAAAEPSSTEVEAPAVSPQLLTVAIRYLRQMDPSECFQWGLRARELGAPNGPPERWAAWVIEEFPPKWRD